MNVFGLTVFLQSWQNWLELGRNWQKMTSRNLEVESTKKTTSDIAIALQYRIIGNFFIESCGLIRTRADLGYQALNFVIEVWNSPSYFLKNHWKLGYCCGLACDLVTILAIFSFRNNCFFRLFLSLNEMPTEQVVRNRASLMSIKSK